MRQAFVGVIRVAASAYEFPSLCSDFSNFGTAGFAKPPALTNQNAQNGSYLMRIPETVRSRRCG
ncbi:hypothetical protein EGR_01199 [Echinococcus granulosus]|uniref:Uncharacterized protein n=1 Tax=Echinococcus granulosus TaxID=6210 RepID=W6UTU0_ECHGR|nr:hypothetical protein EGR_01199 [Echinococcus granulosus]EUB64071.1 hypothetical protein EGR_01199 [Echinococcus granulosus]